MIQSNTNLFERILLALAYISLVGPAYSALVFIPIIWLVTANIRRSFIGDFIKYHCYQAVLLNLFVMFVPQLLAAIIRLITDILDLIPIFQNTVTLLNSGVGLLIFVYQWLIFLVSIYAAVETIRGKYVHIPPISQAVNLILR